jgi:hypothetical protein
LACTVVWQIFMVLPQHINLRQYMHVCRPMPAITFKEGYDIIFASSLRGNSAGPLGVVTFGVGMYIGEERLEEEDEDPVSL